MTRLELIVLLALQIMLAKGFPADVSTQTMDSPESKALNQDFDGKDEDDEREGGEYVQEENFGKRNMIEGDIYIDESTSEILNTLQHSSASSDAVINAVRLWPGGKVPYVFGNKVSSELKFALRQAIADFNRHTCIRIVPRTSERDYLYLVESDGCWSSVGRAGDRQNMSPCHHKGVVIHEFMHALGFFHEQSRLDRDDYVTIHWENIQSGTEIQDNFKKYPHGMADTFNEPYDYDSIMHYPRKAFTSNGYDTIVPKRAGVTIGQRHGFSRIDLRQLNKLYKCRDGVVPTTSPTGPCVDSSSRCSAWAKAGYCVKGPFISHMKKNCRKTCRICKETGDSSLQSIH